MDNTPLEVLHITNVGFSESWRLSSRRLGRSPLTPKIPGPFLPISTSKTLIFEKNPKKIIKL
jgi:hypothetical protein